MKKYILIFFICCTACERNDKPPPNEVFGFRPIYQPTVSNDNVKLLAASKPTNLSKNLIAGSRIYQLEPGVGIHVVDITNPADLKNLGLISIPGSHDFQIRDNQLVSNIYNDLVVVDVVDLQQIKVVDRVVDAVSFQSILVPPTNGYFECPDNSKGVIVGWEQTLIRSPKCRY